MARGDHIRVFRGFYWHHGIDCGDGTVIHYNGAPFQQKGARVRRTSLSRFAKGGTVEVVRRPRRPEAVIRRAESRMDEEDYNLVFNNCEHFATWCISRRATSGQVDVVVDTLTVAGSAALMAAVVAMLRKPGLSTVGSGGLFGRGGFTGIGFGC